MVDQTLFNIIVGVAGSLGGWWLKAMYESLHDLKEQDRKLAEKVAGIEVLVAGSYVRRDDFEKLSDAIFKKLDKISDKLDGKVDKGGV